MRRLGRGRETGSAAAVMLAMTSSVNWLNRSVAKQAVAFHPATARLGLLVCASFLPRIWGRRFRDDA
jgi:hypothetical protein